NTPKGRIVHRLVRAGAALYTAHTNADTAHPGVSDALARVVGLTGELRPLDPDPSDPDGKRGIGRIGVLEQPLVLRDFAQRVVQGLPATSGGVRLSGDPDRLVTAVAVSGGAGDSLLGAARTAGVDVFVTSDLRHHPASEFVEEAGSPALIDVAHFAGEWPWLAEGASHLSDALERAGVPAGANVKMRVSTTVTDAWSQTFHHERAPPPRAARPNCTESTGARACSQHTPWGPRPASQTPGDVTSESRTRSSGQTARPAGIGHRASATGPPDPEPAGSRRGRGAQGARGGVGLGADHHTDQGLRHRTPAAQGRARRRTGA